MNLEKHPASFRDPCGFVFHRDGVLYRQVQAYGREGYDRLMGSGLYLALVSGNLLIPHEEVQTKPCGDSEEAYKILMPLQVPFLSYPYEWCFSQLRDAALLTLRIHALALRHGMILKDASAFNVQFLEGKPRLIDTLSFKTQDDQPWAAYGQFCRHFLAPLALMAYGDARCHRMLGVHPDGIPLDLVAKLLPAWTRLKPGLGLHLHAHARFDRRYRKSRGAAPPQKKSLGLKSMLGLADHLESVVRGLSVRPSDTLWSHYERLESYGSGALAAKEHFVKEVLASFPRGVLWDLGANTGSYSEIAARLGFEVIALDEDVGAVEQNYLACKSRGEHSVLPIVADLMVQSPAAGWENGERLSLLDRGPADAVLALALVHHLAIGQNLPLERVAGFMKRCGRHLLIEFVPKEDPQVKDMLFLRDFSFPRYTKGNFEAAFRPYFDILSTVELPGSVRTLYSMRAKDAP